MKQGSRNLLLSALLASMSLAGVCAETDMNAVFEKDALCDPTSLTSLYATPPSEVTIKALKNAKWLTGKPVKDGGQTIYSAQPGKTWLGFGVKNVIVPSPDESAFVLGTLVAVTGKAENVAAEIEKAIHGGLSDQSFKPATNPAPGQVTLSRVVRYRSGSVYSVVVNEIQTPQGSETAVYCALSMAN